jgi:2-polyprenyl-6-methoxyphenol hydroxylase-like FAD-dependent oxidoreductase
MSRSEQTIETDVETDVAIIGGGPVGLAASLLLARHGIRSVVIEKHATTAMHPKASAFNTRTMEILRQLGIADDVYANTGPVGGVSFYTSLTGYKLGEISMQDAPGYLDSLLASTPSPLSISSQIVLESILKTHADENELIDVRFNTEKTSLRQDKAGVTVEAKDRHSGKPLLIHAAYAVACDGAASPTRKELGRELIGPPAFGHQINVYLEADIEHLLNAPTHQALYWIANPEAAGVFIGLGGDWKKWCFNFSYFPDRGESPEDFTEEKCLEKIRKAIGTDELPIKILSIGSWVLCGQVIDQMRDGRVFFGGDAAHLNIPTGGFGFNTGMQEIHNLAWKIAYVLKGQAPESLLDSYETERRDIAVYNIERSRENAYNIRLTGAGIGAEILDADEIELDTEAGRQQRQVRSDAIADQSSHFIFLGQEIGFGYWDSTLVTPDGSPHYVDEHGVEDPVATYIPNARPGARAPHCWLTRSDHDEPVSTIDLFDTGFTLLVTPDNQPESIDTTTPLTIYSVGEPGSNADLIDVSGDWHRNFGIAASGAVLIRPDGHVAWRSRGPIDETELSQALAKSLAQ